MEVAGSASSLVGMWYTACQRATQGEDAFENAGPAAPNFATASSQANRRLGCRSQRCPLPGHPATFPHAPPPAAACLAELVDVEERLQQAVHVARGALVLQPHITGLLARVIAEVLGHTHLDRHLQQGQQGWWAAASEMDI